MLTLDSWPQTPCKSPQTYFPVTITGFLHCTVSVSRLPLKNLSKKKSNKQLLCTNTAIYGVWSAIFFFIVVIVQSPYCFGGELLCETHQPTENLERFTSPSKKLCVHTVTQS